MIRLIKGYLKTIGQYYDTKKGRHDILDYARGIAIIVFVCVVAVFLLSLL